MKTNISAAVRHTNTAERDGLGSEEHEIVAVLHASDYTISVEVLPHRSRQCLVICFCQLHSSTVILAHHLQQLRKNYTTD